MKRSDERDERDGGGAKRQRGVADEARGINAAKEDEFWGNKLRLLIPSRVAGSVIGKGGDTIRRLRSEYEATVTVPDSSAPERIINLSGSVDKLVALVADILPSLNEGRDERGGGGASAGRDDNKLELRLLVHQSHAGAIIGRGGSVISQLRKDTGAQIKVFSETCPYSTERVALVSGAAEEITKCVEKIHQLCEDIPIKGGIQEYLTDNYDPQFVAQYGGIAPDGRLYGAAYVGRKRAGDDGGGEWDSGAAARFARPTPAAYTHTAYPPFRPADYGRGGGVGVVSGGGYGDDGYYDRRSSPSMQRDITSAVRPHNRHGDDGTKAKSSLPPEMLVPQLPHLLAQKQKHSVNPWPTGAYKQAQVTIPNELGGTIIGRGGERINLIRAESGAHVEVAAPGAGPIPNDRIITISGSDEQIQMAQYLLQRAVRESPAGRKYLDQGMY